MKNNLTQVDYTQLGGVYQPKLPLDIEIILPTDAPVRLLSRVMEEMDYRKLYQAYSQAGRKAALAPEILFKIMVYGYMNGIYSGRKLEEACRRDTHFMFLLEGHPAPDHSTFDRFRTERLNKEVREDLFCQLTQLLHGLGEISGRDLFVDGTKIEANANKYSFVWKKSTQKNEAKMQEKMRRELPKLAESFGLKFRLGDKIKAKHLQKLRKQLKGLQQEQGVTFVHGKGQRKTELQRAIEQVEGFIKRQKLYDDYNHSFGNRNSFSKTDRDATFMHMKDDHMRNSQLKPGYNVQIGVDAEYIIGLDISSERSDVNTMLPFLERLKEAGFSYERIIADAGYESEENYSYLEAHGQQAYIKPTTYERSKTKKYKSDISLRENMIYSEEHDFYTCAAGRYLFAVGTKTGRSASGYESVTTIYQCENCNGCELKTKCIKSRSKKPLEERNKTLYVSKKFLRQRATALERISSDLGILLRVNRSIQVEGAFGVIKEDMGFRRFLTRGKDNVKTELTLLCFAYNILKLHRKIQGQRCGQFLHEIRAA